MQRFAELTGPLTPEAQTADVAAYLEFLTSQPAVRPGPIGVVGFCFGGAMALRAAAAAPDKVAAAASFHGGNLYKPDDPASPHLLLPRVSARLYFGHATADPTMSADAILHFEAALADWGGSFASETYDGASHGWTVPDNPVFNPTQADRAFAKLTQLFQEALH
jgi:carboxymethylenebutenolidase